MNKSDLINAVNNHSDKPYRVRKSEIERIVNIVLDTMQDSLSKGEKVAFTGFGSFETYDRKARTGRNPRTGTAIQIPASRGVKFSPGKLLKNAVK